MTTLHISPLTKRNGISLTLLGLLVTSIMIFILFFLEEQLIVAVISLLLVGVCCTFIGLLKLLEPRVSLSLCHDCLQYHHKWGGWVLKWRNIQRFDRPSVRKGLTWHPLPYIGIRIRNYDEFLTWVTPRLAVHLLTEQRSLLIALLHHEQECDSGGCLLEEELFEDSHYRSANGRLYHGVVAMFANRMARLRILTGLDLLLPEGSLDREPDDFLRLLRDYQRTLPQIN